MFTHVSPFTHVSFPAPMERLRRRRRDRRTAEGWDVKVQLVSVVKSNLKGKKKTKAAPAPITEADATPALPKDAVSIGLLQKAKKLAAQLGGIQEAKAAINAPAQLLD